MLGLSKRICFLMMLSLQLSCSTQLLSAGASREHYDPAYLNQAAMAALAIGERGTAVILLERAAVLAPQNTLIRDNLAALRQGGAIRVMQGVPLRATAPASATATGQSSQAKPPTDKTGESALPAMGIWPPD